MQGAYTVISNAYKFSDFSEANYNHVRWDQ